MISGPRHKRMDVFKINASRDYSADSRRGISERSRLIEEGKMCPNQTMRQYKANKKKQKVTDPNARSDQGSLEIEEAVSNISNEANTNED